MASHGQFRIEAHAPKPPRSILYLDVGEQRASRVKKIAKANGVTMAALVRQMIDHCLADLFATD